MPPYVSGFTNDIFISFAHNDNWAGWVKAFEDHLQHRLVEIGVNATIWRDEKLDGVDVFSDVIFDQLQKSALLISIVSPSGIQSHWCEDERQAFERFAALNGGFRVANKSRAVKVVKTPLPNDEQQDLFGVTGYQFYKREPQAHHFEEFDQDHAEFARLCLRLAQDIKILLDKFVEHLNATPRKETIYVATTTPDLKRSRNAIVQQLEDWGYAIAPNASEPPPRLASFEAVAKAELAASIFSVHFATDQPNIVIEGRRDSIVKQYELAQSLRKDRIVWVEPGRKLYAEFDDALNSGLQNGVEILKDRTLEDLKDVIEERLNKERRQDDRQGRIQNAVEVYMICDRADHPSLENAAGGLQARAVQQYLNQKGLLVMPSPFSEMEWSELEEEYKAQLQVSNAVMLYWGTARENWFLKIRRIIVGERMRRNKTSDAERLTEAFYFGSPLSGKLQYEKLAEFVIQQDQGFEPNKLTPLLNRLLPNEEAG